MDMARGAYSGFMKPEVVRNKFLSLCVASLLASGCGQKGELYLPDKGSDQRNSSGSGELVAPLHFVGQRWSIPSTKAVDCLLKA